ncbi:MAG: Lrp/AsnC family transcriptional regulator [Fibrobacter sp.]|nr:Lrp/AsnC family transcriptional regulator [Fibrobacter sp.]
MTDLEQQILDIIQDGFPVAERPYAVLAEKFSVDPVSHDVPSRVTEKNCVILAPVSHDVPSRVTEKNCVILERSDGIHKESCITEQSVFEAVERFRASGVIRRIGGVYDSRKLGFVSRLCAGIVPAVSNGAPDDSALEKFAAVVAGIPAITHNYVRSHRYNVWFTVIAENEQFVQKIVDKLQKETNMYNVHILASKRMFKINTVMKGRDEKNDGVILSKRSASKDLKASSHLEARRATSYLVPDSDKLRIRLLSGDIPHTLTPFADIFKTIQQSQMSEKFSFESFLDTIREDLSTRRMRRFGAVLRHQEAGFAHNAMVCFCIDGVAEAGAILAANPRVSHCYEREPFEDFPYNLYAMFHAASAEELDRAIAEAAQSLSAVSSLSLPNSESGKAPDFAVLHSVRELKKTSFTFFAE